MTKPQLIWIGGASTAGKTTIIPYLKSHLPEETFTVHDFDEKNFGAASNEAMRAKAIRWWLQRAYRNAQRGKNTVIGGAMFPTEIEEHRELLRGTPLKICVLDMHHAVIDKRLRARLRNPVDREKWNRSVGLGPKESVALNIETARRYRRECKQFGCKVFNTSRSHPERTAKRIARWILNMKG